MRNGKKVLIIDDEIDLCLLLKEYFIHKKYEVAIAHTLDEGRAKLKDNQPNILFLDNNLPDGTGWSSAPVIAAENPDMDIILMSAFHPTVPVMPSYSRFRTLEKPIGFAQLDKQFTEL